MIHSDVCSLFPVQSFQGKQYFVSFIDDYSRHATIYFIHKKSEVPAMFKLFNNTIVLNCACVRVLQSDNGREYVGNKFSDYLRNISIQFEPAPAYTPQYNGVAERFN
jgi:transposase InsO family protein